MKGRILGFFEDFVTKQGDRTVCLGTKPCEYTPGRIVGSEGIEERVITEPITLHVGTGRLVTYKASPQKPLVVQVGLQILTGRMELRGGEITDGPYFDTDTMTVYGIPGFNAGSGWKSAS